jgi:hypothetical protein
VNILDWLIRTSIVSATSAAFSSLTVEALVPLSFLLKAADAAPPEAPGMFKLAIAWIVVWALPLPSQEPGRIKFAKVK